MPTKVVKGDDGKYYMDIPGVGRYPADPPADAGADSGSMMGNVGRKVWDTIRSVSPELVGAGTAALAPETGGLSLLAPPLAAAGTEALKQWADSGSTATMNPASIATRGGINALPGVLGRIAGMLGMGTGGVTRGVEAMASRPGWAGTVASGISGAADVGVGASPRAAMLAKPGSAAPIIADAQSWMPHFVDEPDMQAELLKKIAALKASAGGRIGQGVRGLLAGAEGYGSEDGR